MAVRKRTNTLSDSRLARFTAATDRVLGAGPDSGSTAPYGDSDTGDLWFEITGSTSLNTNRWKYAGKLYRGAFATQPLSSTIVYARNTFERNANANTAAGYTFTATACGSPHALRALATGLRLPVIGELQRTGNGASSDAYYVISLRNNPDLVGVAGVQG